MSTATYWTSSVAVTVTAAASSARCLLLLAAVLGLKRGEPWGARCAVLLESALAVCILTISGCFETYGSGPGAATEGVTSMGHADTEVAPDGPSPCGSDECSADEICLQPGAHFDSTTCALTMGPRLCVPRHEECEGLRGRDFAACEGRAEGKCGYGCFDSPDYVDGVLQCNDTECHCVGGNYPGTPTEPYDDSLDPTAAGSSSNGSGDSGDTTRGDSSGSGTS